MSNSLQLLFQLFSSTDGKQILLIRYFELQIQFLRRRVKGRLVPTKFERAAFARLAKEIGRKDLAGCFNLFHPETLLRWQREQIPAKFDGSKKRGPGRPSSSRILESMVLRLAFENPT